MRLIFSFSWLNQASFLLCGVGWRGGGGGDERCILLYPFLAFYECGTLLNGIFVPVAVSCKIIAYI